MALFAVVTKCWASAVETFWAWRSKVIVANPVVPSALIWDSPSEVRRGWRWW